MVVKNIYKNQLLIERNDYHILYTPLWNITIAIIFFIYLIYYPFVDHRKYLPYQYRYMILISI